MTKQIMVFTGARGVGKSTALSSLIPPTKEAWASTLVFDTEDSWSDLAKRDEATGRYYYNLHGLTGEDRFFIGAFVRAYDRLSPSEDLLLQIRNGKLPWVSTAQKSALTGYYDFFIETLNTYLAMNKFKYVLIDTIEPVEAALTVWVENNASKAGWNGSKKYGRLETEGVRPLYENIIEGIARRGVEIIGLTSHLKQPWENDKPVLNKVEPGGRLKLLTRIISLFVWLVLEPQNDDGAPAGLILKSRFSHQSFVDGKYVRRRVLPERVPHFTWDDVQAYMEHPADPKNPKEGEVMSEQERKMISEMLDDAQMSLMILGEQAALEREKANNASILGATTFDEPEIGAVAETVSAADRFKKKS